MRDGVEKNCIRSGDETMARICSIAIVVICLLTLSAPAQEPKTLASRTVVLDLSVIEINRNQLEEVERLTKEKAKLDRFIADGKARPVVNVQLRARSGENASARIGQRVPIQIQTTRPVTTQGIAPAQGIPQIQYENTGLSLDAQPTVIDNDRVMVKLKIELNGLVKSANPLEPAFVQRSFNDTVQVRANEMALLLGVVQHEFLWNTSSQTNKPPPDPDQSYGSFVVLLSVRLLD